MSKSKTVMRDLYFTIDHEWIDFQGTVAYIGVSNFKLSGLKHIKKIAFSKSPGIKKKGDVLAIIHCKNCKVPVYMPADGRILSLNDNQPLSDLNIIQMQPENDGWLAFIGLTQPYERKGLMQLEQYKHFTKKRS
jgi:glycine cleavage system H protein